MIVVGASVEGRAIEARSFGGGPTRALVHGGIHGDEPGSVLACLRLAAALEAAPPTNGRIVVLPCVNPDGAARNHKDNARGVDLNRNFPSQNFGGHRPGYHPGPSPLSEPESAALAALIDAERPALLIALHQPFACVNWDGPAEAIAERVALACGWPARRDLGYPTPGSFGSLYGVDRGLPVITLELPKVAGEPQLAAAVAGVLAALK